MQAALTKKTKEKSSGQATQVSPQSSRSVEYGLGAAQGIPLFLQPKLAISQPGDPYEQEADRVADQVMRMPAPTVQRQCTACAAGGPLCPACEEEGAPMVSRKAEGHGISADDVPSSVHSALASPGQPLSPLVRAFFEPRFGQDLGHVRVHTDGEAHQSAREINALAYTVGSHVVFGADRYTPSSTEGRRLLAHELTHVMQQDTMSKTIHRSCGAEEIGSPSGCTENSIEVPMRPRYLFQVSCDEFAPGNEFDLRMDALSIQPGEHVEVHGLASEEGSVEFNVHLSCARALRAKAVIEEVLRDRGVTASIAVFSHGPQLEGERYLNRSVAIVRSEAPTIEEEMEEPEEESSEPAQCSGIYSDGRDETSDGDHDLDQTRHSGEESPDIFLYDTVFGESGALSDYTIGFFAGTALEGTSDDGDLYDHFISGDGSRMNFVPSTDMAAILGGSSDFTPFADGFEDEIVAYINAHGTLCDFDGDTYIRENRPGYFHDPLFAWAVMGGYAGMEARVSYDNSTGTITVRYKIFDHYGAGVSDAWSALPGLSALYYLQHFHGVSGTQYTPFIWSVEIRRARNVL